MYEKAIVTTKKDQVEEEDIIFEGMFHEGVLNFEEVKEEDSAEELVGDELEAAMDAYLLEFFADER